MRFLGASGEEKDGKFEAVRWPLELEGAACTSEGKTLIVGVSGTAIFRRGLDEAGGFLRGQASQLAQ